MLQKKLTTLPYPFLCSGRSSCNISVNANQNNNKGAQGMPYDRVFNLLPLLHSVNKGNFLNAIMASIKTYLDGKIESKLRPNGI